MGWPGGKPKEKCSKVRLTLDWDGVEIVEAKNEGCQQIGTGRNGSCLLLKYGNEVCQIR